MRAALNPSQYMQLALDEARKSPPKPTNFRVGALVIDEDKGQILATGYTLELPGNTHAEQCCFQKLATEYGIPEDQIGEILPLNTVLYTTMEPCVERLSGNLPCLERILKIRKSGRVVITKVYCGVQEPDTFVKGNSARSKLESSGIQCIYVSGFEAESLQIATVGHENM